MVRLRQVRDEREGKTAANMLALLSVPGVTVKEAALLRERAASYDFTGTSRKNSSLCPL